MSEYHNEMAALLSLIEEKQREMIGIGMKQGLLNEETIKCSQELDQLICSYQSKIYTTIQI